MAEHAAISNAGVVLAHACSHADQTGTLHWWAVTWFAASVQVREH